MLELVNRVNYGLMVAISAKDLAKARHAARCAPFGLIWVNNAGRHFLGAGYGGYK